VSPSVTGSDPEPPPDSDELTPADDEAVAAGSPSDPQPERRSSPVSEPATSRGRQPWREVTSAR
jgi:hypothetical protein